jgi:translation elongation factor EF-Tu-like GTPase
VLSKEVSVPSYPADFEAELRFLTSEEGGRQGPVYQGYRPDLRYDGDVNELWMIWPVFIDDVGAVIVGDVPLRGKVHAQMYVVVDEMRKTIHRQRLAEGVKFFLHEGPHVVAEGVVTHIVGLHREREPA